LVRPFYGGKKKITGEKNFKKKVILGSLGEINFKKDFENCCQKIKVKT
jgi:hypothetical protein